VIAHDRRCILHFNVTRHPNSVWITQQLREAFPDDHPHKYVIFDRDAKFGIEVLAAAQQLSWHLSELPSEALGPLLFQNPSKTLLLSFFTANASEARIRQFQTI